MPSLAAQVAPARQLLRADGIGGLVHTLGWEHAKRWPRLARACRGLEALGAGPEAVRVRRRHGSPELLVAFFGGIGDELLLTTVLRELRRRGVERVWAISEHADIWRGNPDPALLLPWDRRYARWIAAFGWNTVYPYYTWHDPVTDRDVPPRRHILAMMCERVGIVGPIERRPYLALTDAERSRGARVPAQLAIQSGGLTARFAMQTKQWFPERYQAVVDALRGAFNFVQIGSPTDPPLDGVLDLRGRTTLRETAAILANSLAFVGQVGMLMHLARAVECRSVIIYGGREHPAQTGYGGNENLYAPVPCSPCWLLNSCDYGMRCMRAIEPADVVCAIERQVARHGEPLPVDTDLIEPPPGALRVGPSGEPLVTTTDPRGATREVVARLLPEVGTGPRAASRAAAGPPAPQTCSTSPQDAGCPLYHAYQ